jgi:ABC-type polar amino acid transport system ATPase subunit
MRIEQTEGLTVDSISKAIGGAEIVRNVSFQVPIGSVLAVVGPSGAGKTTLLRALCGLETLDTGRVAFVDHRRKLAIEFNASGGCVDEPGAIGMVFQDMNLWPHMTVRANVTYALKKVKKVDAGLADAMAEKMLGWIGLAAKADRFPNSLSGGEAQRAAIARTLVMEPALILFDEITSALDVKRAFEVLDVVRRLADEGKTMVIVTHELRFAKHVASQLAVMQDGEFVEIGPSQQLFDSPRSPITKEFLSYA